MSSKYFSNKFLYVVTRVAILTISWSNYTYLAYLKCAGHEKTHLAIFGHFLNLQLQNEIFINCFAFLYIWTDFLSLLR